jgi:hypothetical protein
MRPDLGAVLFVMGILGAIYLWLSWGGKRRR